MQVKYLLVVDDVPVAIKFHPINRVLILGGPVTSLSLISALKDSYFQVGEEVKSEMRNGRCRFEFHELSRQKFEEVIEQIKGEGLVPQVVTSFGRIMR